MSIIKLIATVSLAVALLTMVTSNQLSIYATPTTEDDGWVEGDDDSQGEISSQEELEESYEGSQWEDDIGSNEFKEATDNDDENDDELVECEDGSLVETEELCEQSEALVTCSDGSSAATQAECPPVPTAVQEQLQTCQDGSVVSVNEACPELETLTCPDGSTVSVDEDCPPTDKPLPDCDGSSQDCITSHGDVCPAGSAAHECELLEPITRELPDNDCLFNTELPKCAPDPNGKCPDDFGTNEDGRCFVIHNECPDGYHTTEDDETGECNPNSECEDNDYLLVNDDKSCREKRSYCLETPTPDECKDKDKNKEQNEMTNIFCKKNPLVKECYHKEKDDDKQTRVVHKTTVIQGSSATATASVTANEADISNCRLDGSANGIQQKFDATKYLACGLFAAGQKAYSDGFVVGCTQIGNTQLVCQSLVDSSILNTKTQPIQTQTQTATQPTQTQPLTTSTQAIQPAALS